MSYKKVLNLLTNKQTLNFSDIQNNGFRAYLPTLPKCKALEGSGNVSDTQAHFVCVVADTNKANKELAVILMTATSEDKASLEIQNIQTLLERKESFAEVRRVITDHETIQSLLIDGEQYQADLAQQELDITANSSNEDSKALATLKQHVIHGINLGASDIDIVTQNSEKAWVKYCVDGRWSVSKPVAATLARDMMASALQTQSKDFSGQFDETRIVDVTVDLKVEIQDKNDALKSKFEAVGLRGHLTYNHDGQIMTSRIMRLEQESNLTVHDLGFDADLIAELVSIMENPYGTFLVTAPTNNGKSTTLVAIYETVENDRKIVLIEDPVEYIVRHPNCYQRSPKNKDGSKLKDLLKGTLRQAPSIVGVSEVRDEEVAKLIMTQSLTGSLMVSTLHSPNAISALERMVDMKISPKTLAERNGVKGVFAQSLIPRLCGKCKVQTKDKKFGDVFTKNKYGCESCNHSGFKGRVPVGEFLKVTDDIREFVLDKNWRGLEKHLSSKGWLSMSDRVARFIKSGEVCPREAHMKIGNILDEGDISLGNLNELNQEERDLVVQLDSEDFDLELLTNNSTNAEVFNDVEVLEHD